MVHQLKQRPNDEELLQLYGLYKQATMGNCKTGTGFKFSNETTTTTKKLILYH